MRWVQTKAVHMNIAERKRMTEIISRNKEAQVEATRLRRQVLQLLEEAVSLGVLTKDNAQEEEKELVVEEIVNVN